MKNKKFIKTATLLSSLMCLAIVSSALSSTIISSKQNDTVKSDINNGIKTPNYVNIPVNDQKTADASLFFETNDTIQGRLTYTVSGSSLTIAGYSGDFKISDGTFKSSVTIEESGVTNTYTVTKIGENAFANCSGLIGTLTFSNTIIEIGYFAFAYCDSLTSIDLENASSLTETGTWAFIKCENLSSVYMCSTLNTIGEYAFSSCSSLENVNLDQLSSLTTIGKKAFCFTNVSSVFIPPSVTSIGEEAFGGSPITDITVDSNNSSYSLVPNNSGKAYILVSGSEKTKWDGSSPVGSLAYGDISYEEVETSEIPKINFLLCDGIRSINFGDKSIQLGKYACGWCRNLNTIYFGNNTPTVSSSDDTPFKGCTSLINVYVPESKIFDISYLTESEYTSLGLNINTNHIVAEASLQSYVKNPENISGTAMLRRTSFGNVSNSTAPNVALTDIGDISLSNENTLNLSNKSSNNITGIYSNAFANSDASIQTVKLGTQINTIQENAFTDAKIKNIDLSDWTAAGFEKLVKSGTISPSWLGNLKSKDLAITVSTDQAEAFNAIAAEIGIDGCIIIDTYPIPTPEPVDPTDDSNLVLGLGLGLGLGAATLIACSIVTPIHVKKQKIRNLVKKGQKSKK